MSKKILQQGIDYFTAGDINSCYTTISKLESNFVKKRLILNVSSGVLDLDEAKEIWDISYPHLKGRLDHDIDNCGSLIKSTKLGLKENLKEIITVSYADLPRSKRIHIDYPDEFLDWLNTVRESTISIDNFEMTQPWGLAAIAALARKQNDKPLSVECRGKSSPGRFAFALGINEVIDGKSPIGRTEVGRTVKMRRVKDFPSIEPIANEISHLLVKMDGPSEDDAYFDKEETRRTIYYVIVELLRNVVQHSEDPLGGIIVAQHMNINIQDDSEQKIQVTVVDAGIGIFKALRRMHEEITTAELALERSLWPYFSGAFDKTKRGTSQNAGLGLFFVSEMAKLCAGTLFISSYGASLLLKGDPEGEGNNQLTLLPQGFPGTLVVFELPKRGVADYDSLIKTIGGRAQERASNRSYKSWFLYEDFPSEAFEFTISHAVENTVEAEKFSKKLLIPRIEAGQPVIINFENLQICTQSYMHALFFNAIRIASKNGVRMYAKNIAPPVRDGIRLLESYALDE